MVRTFLTLWLAAVLALTFTAARADDKKGSDIDGEYTPVAAVKGGKEAPAEELKVFQGITIKDGTLTFKIKAGDKEDAKTAKMKIDPAKKPAEIDLSPTDGPEKGKTVPGIYALDKDELKLAFMEGPVETLTRPKDFTSTADNKVFVLTLKKKK